jgi:ribosomal protein S18 acetylase RimI-like enzyme
VIAELHVREAVRVDAAVIADIGRRAMSAQYAGRAAIERSYALEAVEACIDRCRTRTDAQFLVAEQRAVVTGFLHFDAFGPEPELHRLYVESEARRAGVGTALMHELHARLPSTANYMLLVVAGNERAIRFYERLGL